MIWSQPVLDRFLKSRSLLCGLTVMDQFLRPSVTTSLIEDVWNVKGVLDFVPVLEDLGENRIVKQLPIIGNINYRRQVQLLIGPSGWWS